MSVGSYSKTRAWDLGVRVLRYGTGNKRVYPRRRPRFYCQLLQNKPELASKLLNQLDLDGNLKQLTHSPLYTVLLCLLCEDIDGIFGLSDTQLYLKIVECVLRIYRKNKRWPDTNCKDLTDVYKTQLKQLGRIAWKCLLHDDLYFEKSELKNVADELTEYGFLSFKRGLGPGFHYFVSQNISGNVCSILSVLRGAGWLGACIHLRPDSFTIRGKLRDYSHEYDWSGRQWW